MISSEVAKKEMAQIEALSKNFKSGFTIREQYINEVKSKALEELANFDQLEFKVNQLNAELEKAKNIQNLEEEIEKSDINQQSEFIKIKIFNELGDQDSMTIDDRLHLLKRIFNEFELSVEKVKEINSGTFTDRYTSDDETNPDIDSLNKDESSPAEDDLDIESDYPREYGDDGYSGEAPSLDHDNYGDIDEEGNGHIDESRHDMHSASSDNDDVDTHSETPNPIESENSISTTTCNLGEHSTV